MWCISLNQIWNRVPRVWHSSRGERFGGRLLLVSMFCVHLLFLFQKDSAMYVMVDVAKLVLMHVFRVLVTVGIFPRFPIAVGLFRV